MPVREATQVHRVFRESRGFVVILVRKGIQAVKVLREILALRDQRVQ